MFSLMMEHQIRLRHCFVKLFTKRYWAVNWILALHKYIIIIISYNYNPHKSTDYSACNYMYKPVFDDPCNKSD